LATSVQTEFVVILAVVARKRIVAPLNKRAFMGVAVLNTITCAMMIFTAVHMASNVVLACVLKSNYF
jgi:hypothetical protein